MPRGSPAAATVDPRISCIHARSGSTVVPSSRFAPESCNRVTSGRSDDRETEVSYEEAHTRRSDCRRPCRHGAGRLVGAVLVDRDRDVVAPPAAAVPAAETATPRRAPARRATAAKSATAKATIAPDVVPTLPATQPELQARLKPVLNRGTRMDVAAEGFRDAVQFASVAHAARNTGVPFVVLKHRVLEEKQTLARAIGASRPISMPPTRPHARAMPHASTSPSLRADAPRRPRRDGWCRDQWPRSPAAPEASHWPTTRVNPAAAPRSVEPAAPGVPVRRTPAPPPLP